MVGQLTRQRRTPAALNAPLSMMETWDCFDSSLLFVLSRQCVEFWSMLRPLNHQATWFPHISSLSFPCGQLCQHSVVQLWNLRTCWVWHQGLNFLPLLAAPNPTPFLPHSLYKCLSSYTEQSVFLWHGHSRHKPLQGHDPCFTVHLNLRGLAPQTQSMTLWCHTRACAYL